jgi:hypothetical protein
MDRNLLFGYHARPNARQKTLIPSGSEMAVKPQPEVSLTTLQELTGVQPDTDAFIGVPNKPDILLNHGLNHRGNQNWIENRLGFARQLANNLTQRFQFLSPSARGTERLDFQPVRLSGQDALDALPQVLPQTVVTPQLRRLADQTQVLVLDAHLDDQAQEAEVQQALNALRKSHPQGQNHRVMVIALDERNALKASPQVSFWGEQGRLVGSGETEAARLLQEEVLPAILTNGQLDSETLGSLGQNGVKFPRRAGVQFGIIDPFTIGGAVLLGVGAASGGIYSWRSARAKKKWLKDQVDGVNQYLAKMGSIDKVNDKNIFSLHTVELFLEPSNQVDDMKKMEEWIGLIWDNLPKEAQKKPETYYALLQTYIKKGLPHPSETVRQYFINFFEQSSNIKREFYTPFYERLRVEQSPELAKQLEGILLKLVEPQDRISLQAALAVEDSPYFRPFLIKSLALPQLYDSSVLDIFLEEIPKAENAHLLDVMMNAIAAKITPQDASSLVNHLDSSNERLKTLALKSLTEFNSADYFPQIWQQAQKDLPLCQNLNLKGLYETAIQKLFKDEHFQVIQPILTPGSQPDLQAQALNLLASNKRAKKPDFVPALFTLLQADSAQNNAKLIQSAILQHVDASQKALIFDKLNDTNPSIRSLAAGCLPSVASGADWQVLYEAYKKETHPEVRAALGTVLNVNTTDATPQSELINLIGNNGDPLLQGLAVKGLRGKGIETLPAIMTALNTMIQPPALPHGGQPRDQLGRDTEDLLHENLTHLFMKPVGLNSMGGHIDPKYDTQKQDLLPQLSFVRQALNSNSKKIQDLSMSILQGYRDTQVVPQLFEMFENDKISDKDRLRVALFDLIQSSDWPLVQEKAKSERSQVRALAAECLPFLNLSPDAVPVLMCLMWQEKSSELQIQFETQILSLLKKLDEAQTPDSGGLNSLEAMQTSLGSHGLLKSILEEANTAEQVLKTLDILIKAAPKGLRQTVLQRYGVEQFEKPKAVLKEWLIQDIKTHEAFKVLQPATVLPHLKTALFLPDKDIQAVALDTLKSQQTNYFNNNPELCLLLLNYLESPEALNKDIAIPLLARLTFERVDLKPSAPTGGTSVNAVDPISEFETSMRTVLTPKMKSPDESTRFYAMTIFVKFANKNDIAFLTQSLETETSKRIQDTIEAELFRYTPRNNHYAIFTSAFKAAKAPHAKLVFAKVISKHHEMVFDDLRDYVSSAIAAAASSPTVESTEVQTHLENVKTFYRTYLENLDKQYYNRSPLTQEQGARIASLLTVPDEKVQKFATHLLTRYGFAEPKKYPIEVVLQALESNVVPEKYAFALRKHVFEEQANNDFAPFYQAKMNTQNTELKALCMRVLKKLAKPADFNTLDAMRAQFSTLSAESQEDWLNVMKNTPIPAESITRMISAMQAEENDAILQSLLGALCVSPEVTLMQLSGLHQWVNNLDRFKRNQTLQSQLQKPIEETILKLMSKPEMTLADLEVVLTTSSLNLKNQAIERLRTLECPTQKRFEILTQHIENTLLGPNGQAPVDLENILLKIQTQGDDQVFLQNLYQMLESDAPILKRLATRMLGAWAQKMNPLQAGGTNVELVTARQEDLNKAVFQLLKQAVRVSDKELAKQSIEVLFTLGSNPAVLQPLLTALALSGPQTPERPASPFNSMAGKNVIVDALKTFGQQALPQLFQTFEALSQAKNDVEQDPYLKKKIEQALVGIIQEKGVPSLEMIQVGLKAPSKAIQESVIGQIKNLLTSPASQLGSSPSLVQPFGVKIDGLQYTMAMNQAVKNEAASEPAKPTVPADLNERLKSTQGKALISILVNYIKSDSCLEPDKALEVLVSTSQSDQDENHNYLLTLLTVPNAKVKLAALQMIGERLRPSDLPTLFRTLNSELAKTTAADPFLLTSLKTLIVKAGNDSAMLAPLVMELEDATNPVAKQTAVCALEKMGADALPFLLDTLEKTERNAANDLLVQDLERAIVSIAQTASPEVAMLLKDKLTSENREFTKLVSLALTQCLSKWEKITDKSQIELILPVLEILSNLSGAVLIKGTASKIKSKLQLTLVPTPTEPVKQPTGK